jgi:hypothetical protein
MLRLALREQQAPPDPGLKRLKEAAPRQGIFERDQFEAVRRHVAPDLQVLVASPTLLWRMSDELRSLERGSSTLAAGTRTAGWRRD